MRQTLHFLKSSKSEDYRTRCASKTNRLNCRATNDLKNTDAYKIAIIGGGPAGLFAAQKLARLGAVVDVYEKMRTPGLKFLIAGRGGLNLTHSEPFEDFKSRYGGSYAVDSMLNDFGPDDMRAWAGGLGVETFIGTSRRVFPSPPLMDRAAPVLRSWLSLFKDLRVRIHVRRRWVGFSPGGGPPPAVLIEDEAGARTEVRADAVLLALGGASWPKLGSDGAWVELLAGAGVPVAELRPNNVGFRVPWPERFLDRFGGVPVKNVRLSFGEAAAAGDLMITAWGVEGGAVCALSSRIVGHQASTAAPAVIRVDLRPGVDAGALEHRLRQPSLRKASLSNRLRKAARLPPAAAALLRLCVPGDTLRDPPSLARAIKAMPLELGEPQGFDRAISTSGGVAGSAAARPGSAMLRALPGVFVAGEMLDWEAPTGGYLLTGTFSTANAAADEIVRWLRRAEGRGGAANERGAAE